MSRFAAIRAGALASTLTKGVLDSFGHCHDSTIFHEPPLGELSDRNRVSFLLREPYYNMTQDIDYFGNLESLDRALCHKEGVQNLDELLSGLSEQQQQFFWQTYGWFFASQAIDRLGRKNKDQIPFSKGCMIGAESHVGPDGNISICHKAQRGDSFVTGNVESPDLYMDKIENLEIRLHDYSACSNCFVQRFCDLCYEKLNGDPRYFEESRQSYCLFMRQSIRFIFQSMLGVMTKNPNLWSEVGRILAAG